MKLTHLFAAATMIAGLGISTAASAQDYRQDGRYDRHDDRRYDNGGDRRDDRRDYRDDRRHYDNGTRYGGNRHARRCHTEYRHHRRVTVCYR